MFVPMSDEHLARMDAWHYRLERLLGLDHEPQDSVGTPPESSKPTPPPKSPEKVQKPTSPSLAVPVIPSTADLGQALARFLQSEIQGKPTTINQSTGCYNKDLMTLLVAPNVDLEQFISRFAQASQMDANTMVMIAALMMRLSRQPMPPHTHNTGAQEAAIPCNALIPFDLNPCNVYRLFAAVAIVTCKFMNDRIYPMS